MFSWEMRNCLLFQFQWHLCAHLRWHVQTIMTKKESTLFVLFLIFSFGLRLFPIIRLKTAGSKEKHTYHRIDDDIFEMCTGLESFLFKVLGNILCACTTVVIVHIDPTVSHRLRCASASHTSQCELYSYTRCMQLHSSQINLCREGGPRAKAHLPNLQATVVFHHLWCKLLLCCFGGFVGALAASATDVPKSQRNSCCSLQVCIRWAASKVPRTLPLASKTQTVSRSDHHRAPRFVSRSLSSLFLFQKNDSSNIFLYILVTLCGIDEAKSNRNK